MRDLVFLLPDKDTEFTVRGAVGRAEALGVRPLTYEILVDPGRDGGVRRRGAQTLRTSRSSFRHALMILDYEGSGAAVSAAALEADLDARLSADWGVGNAKAIVVEPEIDAWMWGADSHIRSVLSWSRGGSVRDWLVTKGFEFDGRHKPLRPKEAFQAACEDVRLPRSSSRYKAVASRISLSKCEDPSFQRLRASLLSWFGS